MKRVSCFILALLLVPVFLLAAETAVQNSAFSVVNRAANGMRISFRLPAYTLREISVKDQQFQKIILPGASYTAEPGLPELPVFTATVAIPAQGSVSIEAMGATQRTISQINPYPAQDATLAEANRSFAQELDFYFSSESYPAQDLQLSAPQIMRELRVVHLAFSPFIYDAGTGELKVRESVDLQLNFTSNAGQNELQREPEYLSASFEKIYQAAILNFDDYRDLLLANTPPRYLIIHGNTTDSVFHAALDDYVLWKRQKGADVDIASTATNSAGSSTSSIQSYIRNRYNNPATRPDFVILIGDTTGSYTVPCFQNNGGSTDYPYSFMNTGDILGDVFVGRISAENITQLKTILNKTYLYERDMNLDTASWLNHLLLVGDNAPSGISTQYISKYIKEMAQELNPDATFTELYGPDFNSFSTGINAAFNQGIGFYSFRGYIDYAPPAEGSLFNSYKLPHVVATTCGSGNFDSTAESETIIRYGTEANPKGAVTCIGMATSSTHTTFNNVLHGGVFEGIYVRGMRTMGEAVLHAKLYMNEMFGVSSPENVEKFSHWFNLMGDPSMEVYTAVPNSFAMQTLDAIPLGLSLLDVEVKDQENLPVEGASVVLSLGSEILARAYTDVEGRVILVLPTAMNTGSARITVSKHDFKPLIHSIDIQSIATLVPDEMIVDDAVSGNDNGIITAGETVDLYFGLKNMGTGALNRVSGTLVTDSPWVEILQGTVTYPRLAGGASGIPSSPLVIKVAPDTPHNTMLRLHLILDDTMGGIYDVSEFLPVESACAEYVAYTVLDNAEGRLDPGETANLTISIQNYGTAGVANLYGELESLNDLLEITQEEAYFGNLTVNGSLSSSVGGFELYCRTPTLPGMLMPLKLRLYNADGFQQNIYFSLEIGTVSQQHPLGPDSYGYVIYDWTDTAYSEAPVYNWVEIAPQLGGLGTALPISDTYSSSNEGDQVGAQSLAEVDLPFVFQFYGRLYDQITVCSNGFIALGITENAEFRNFRLPGAMGPSPMIAPFWDDLATTSSSSISYWFDRPNRRFIVEWYNLVNGKNGSSPETFQLILYDQNYYYSSLGDGPIMFQYHTFNNVDSQSGNRHGNFCTIGIEDHTGTRGLEYTFNNTYPTAAAPLTHGTALYITNNPSMYDAPVAINSLDNISLRMGEIIRLDNLAAYFQSVANLNFSLVENEDVSAESYSGGMRILPNADFYGISQIGIRATDPMGRYAEHYFELNVDEAQGHYQDFESGNLPAGWQIGHLGQTTQGWQVLADEAGNHQICAQASSGHNANERLSSQSFNLSGFINTRLRFWMDYLPLGNSSSALQYSFNNITWINIDSYAAAFRGFKEYDLSVLDNRPSVRLRWTYQSSVNSAAVENYWYLDDISLTGLIPDLTPPTMVTELTLISAAAGSISFSWSPAWDENFSHYEVYLATGESVSLSSPMYSVDYDASLANMETNSLEISGLMHARYTLAMRAVDLSGNASELSEPLTVILGAAPLAPENLTIQRLADEIQLSWNAVLYDENYDAMIVSGYNIYASEQPDFEPNADNLIGQSQTNSFTVSLSDGERLFFVVKARL